MSKTATQKKANEKVMKHKQTIIKKKNNQCIGENCFKKPTFNIPTETNALYCFEHKKENMVDIKNKKCIQDNCLKRPSFNISTETKPLYCYKHKKENMVDIMSKKCIQDNCLKRPSFNISTETKPLYCSEHKKENMVDIMNKKCREENCLKLPCFNIPTEPKPLVCECARLNEIVNCIGGKSVIIIRYNPDIVRNNGKILDIKQYNRIDLLVKIIKDELVKDYANFIVKIIQIYYNDNYEKYEQIKEENITKLICV